MLSMYNMQMYIEYTHVQVACMLPTSVDINGLSIEFNNICQLHSKPFIITNAIFLISEVADRD